MNDKDKKMFLGLYQMLLSDSEVHPKELEMLYEIGKNKGGISESEIQKAIFSPNNRLVTVESLNDDERIEYLYNLAHIAWADGVINEKEKETLMDTSIRLGFSEENVKEISEFLIEQAKENKSFENVLQIIKNS